MRAKVDLEATFSSPQILPYQAFVTDDNRMTESLHELGPIEVLFSMTLWPTAVVKQTRSAHRRRNMGLMPMQSPPTTMLWRNYAYSYQLLAVRPPLNVSTAAAHRPGSSRVGYRPSQAAWAQVMDRFAP